MRKFTEWVIVVSAILGIMGGLALLNLIGHILYNYILGITI